ncbi:MAG: hypothetical protein ABID54_07215 [Pseudomonadota bacterium]
MIKIKSILLEKSQKGQVKIEDLKWIKNRPPLIYLAAPGCTLSFRYSFEKENILR